MSLYTPVKYALMILLLIGIAFVIMQLIPELQRSRSNTTNVLLCICQLIVLLIGFFGAYRGNRQLLLTFAIILTILVIFAVTQSQAYAIVGNAVLEIVAIVLAVFQSEMIRSGDL